MEQDQIAEVSAIPIMLVYNMEEKRTLLNTRIINNSAVNVVEIYNSACSTNSLYWWLGHLKAVVSKIHHNIYIDGFCIGFAMELRPNEDKIRIE